MNSDPLVSIVIPAHNAESTLSRALESLIDQTDGRWEAILIDDCSIDATPDIIESYSARDARFVAVEANVKSASASRNAGIEKCRGDRLLFLDSDDWIDQRFLSLMNAALDSSPEAVAAYCNYCRVFPDGSESPVRGDTRIQDDPIAEFNRTCATTIHSVLVKKAAVLNVGGFDTALRTCEDWDLWQKLAHAGGSWIHVDQKLSYYWASDGSLTRDVNRMLIDARRVIEHGCSRSTRTRDTEVLRSVTSDRISRFDPVTAYAYFALWCAGFDCGRNGSSAAVEEMLAAWPGSATSDDAIIEILLDSIMVGTRLVPAKLAGRWNQYGAQLTDLIKEIGLACRTPAWARKIQYGFERKILDYDDLASPRELSLTLGIRVDLRWLPRVHPTGSIDRLYVYVCDGPHILRLLDIGVLGTVGVKYWTRLISDHLRFHQIQKGASKTVQLKLAMYEQVFRRWLLEEDAGSHVRQRTELFRKIASEISVASKVAVPLTTPRPKRGCELGRNVPRERFWEELFDEEDPWNYHSDYEQEKYRKQLELLPDQIPANALELACAEGHFTDLLAPKVEHLIASDISSKALARALSRCSRHLNIDFTWIDLLSDELPPNMDLIVCSEVLYYLADEDELKAVLEKLAKSLRPGGSLILTHAFVLKDNLTRTGFDWENPFGAEKISIVAGRVGDMALDMSIQTELYRVDRYKRLCATESPPVPHIIKAEVTAAIEPEVARLIVPGGAVARRTHVLQRETRQHVPVLMYHRIAADGPAGLARFRVRPELFREQMLWLRRNGYHAITSEQLAWFVANQHPFVGRPVLITFDDGYRDFAEYAWPVLQKNDFTAEVFLVADMVGKTADWDHDFGPGAPLLNHAEIVELAAQGVHFGSHLATHPRNDELSTSELADELIRSRLGLESWLSRPVTSLAAPFGLIDERLRILAVECGYKTIFNTSNKVASLSNDLLDLPRLEIRGDLATEEFAYWMQSFQ
ncbi:trifunctional glycosyltransferase/class I SAM-dependent methyltransferase/polysaccharide deacetylase [Bradyrhizobium cytisi]|uniref:Chitooligosaccharide deacetylase n=1 Tax=Bradyrhizobium cytisi TaxID=515489 RepID=A0A5S4X0N8_9BRAD|nr:trifunctional glycosyltransferase/class I SAM-dependent methyltransferase/polysaccharide deacetylase [Bradyrhizobium cytisi]TYL87165.1 glycosyltransferase [Bradyrhizobium cytisi]